VSHRRKTKRAVRQIQEYFAGTRTRFTLSLDLRGTEFQRSVWEIVSRVPYGEIRSYSDIAREVGKPGGVRAVGSANKHNPLPIIIPCHRIVGAKGAMTGYGGGIPMKETLLRMEGLEVPIRIDFEKAQ
jgi:O-6-methylguanine DNA methyltransferase